MCCGNFLSLLARVVQMCCVKWNQNKHQILSQVVWSQTKKLLEHNCAPSFVSVAASSCIVQQKVFLVMLYMFFVLRLTANLFYLDNAIVGLSLSFDNTNIHA